MHLYDLNADSEGGDEEVTELGNEDDGADEEAESLEDVRVGRS